MGYSWVNKGNANNKSFIFENLVVEYDAYHNKFDIVGDSKITRTQDLVMVLRNLQNATFVNGELKLYVNYYKLS